MHARAPLVLFLTLLAASRASALPFAKGLTQFARDAWQSDQGLPRNDVGALAQTSDGYLWIGTEEGLARFDGARFVVFDRRNTPALADHDIRALFAARDGTLWIGTRGGGLVSFKSGTFARVTAAQGLGDDHVLAIAGDRDGSIWIGTDGGGLTHLANGAFTTLTTRDGLSGNRVARIAQDGAGDLWLGTLGGGLSRMSGSRVWEVDRKSVV